LAGSTPEGDGERYLDSGSSLRRLPRLRQPPTALAAAVMLVVFLVPLSLVSVFKRPGTTARPSIAAGALIGERSSPLTTPDATRAAAGPRRQDGAPPRITWITATGSAGNLWLLGEYGCPTGLCVEILRSDSGGASFARVGAPPVYGARGVTTNGLSIDSLLFVNKQDGYAYARGSPSGERGIYRTDDGGTTWQHVELEGPLASPIVVAGGRAYAVIYRCRSANCTDYDVVTSSATQRSWKLANSLPATETNGQNIDLAAFGSNVWVVLTPQGGGASGRLLVSHDRANTFSELPPDESLGAISCSLTATSTETLWALCNSIHSSFNERSTDGGRRFVEIAGNPASSEFPQTTLFPLSDREAVLLFYNPFVSVSLVWELEVTTDAGASFHHTLGHREVLAVGFASRTTWLALRPSIKAKSDLAWRTTNSGHSWQTVRLPASP
jgi:hypothetical protein